MRAVVEQGQAAAEQVVHLPDRGPVSLMVQIAHSADGMLLADWSLAPDR